ncbi:MAG: S8 family serine peptidase, partial [Phycisphaerales bacterium]|nr:S8 family serine peptidase [Phycisphaerales bacterium]
MDLKQLSAGAALIAVSGLATGVALGNEGISPMDDVLIEFQTNPTPADVAMIEALGGEVHQVWTVVPGMHASLPDGMDAQLAAINGRVVGVEPNLRGQWTTEYDQVWGVRRINCEPTHAAGQRGTGVAVGVMDSGLRHTHEDIFDNFVFGFDFETGSSDFSDPFSHGTHVSGTVAAVANGDDIIGVAPEADLYMLKIGTFFPTSSGTINALQWSLDNGIQVTNSSFSLGSSSLLQQAYDNTWDAGIIHFAASGNGGGGSVGIPARYDSVIAVGATDDRDRRASFSQGGPDLELVAPGVDVYSTTSNSDRSYDFFSGTSMASPHAAGVAALVIAAGIEDTNGNGRVNDEVRQRMIDTAIDLGSPGFDTSFGHGLVNAEAALGLEPSCTADFDGDGELTIFDFLAFQTAFGAGDLAADLTGDGVLDIFDFLEFQNLFVA